MAGAARSGARCAKEQLHHQLPKGRLCHCRSKSRWPRPTYPTDKWYYDNKNSQENAFMGWVFQDSDLYKWLEAAAYAIPYGNRAYLTEKSREAVEIIAAARRRTAIWTPCIPSTACKTDLPT